MLVSHICEHTETPHACMQALDMHIAHFQGQTGITYMHTGTHSSYMQSHIAYAKTNTEQGYKHALCKSTVTRITHKGTPPT